MILRLDYRIGVITMGLALAVMGSAEGQGSWTAPDSEKSRKSPIPPSLKAAERGKTLAQANCVSCHGTTGAGNGPAAIALTPRPADWTSRKIQDETDGEIFWKITTGRGPMPSWKHLSESDRWAIVQYIRTLKK